MHPFVAQSRALVGIVLALTLAAPRLALAQDAEGNPPAPRAPPGPAKVYVHLEANGVDGDDVSVEQASGDRKEPFKEVCVFPCDRYLASDGEFRIQSESVRPSATFRMQSGLARQSFVVRPASKAAFKGGLVLVCLGGPALGLGSLIALLAGLDDDPDDRLARRLLGLGIAVVGVAGLIGGFVLIGNNYRSSVTPVDRVPENDGARFVSVPRDVPWHELGHPATESRAIGVSIPVFGGSF
jgi:hypothetical protein